MDDLTTRVEALEEVQETTEASLKAVAYILKKLVDQNKEIRDEIQSVVLELEADSSSSALEIKETFAKISTILRSLNVKNTALATVLCRELDIDPDLMTEEYRQVIRDMGSVDRFVASLEDPDT